jgi:outer membrane protein insertion porin family
MLKPTLLALFAGACALASAQAPTQASTVSAIQVQGNVLINEAAILSAMSTRQGRTFSEAALSQDRQSILRLGFFRTASVTSQPDGVGLVKVLVQVSEYAAPLEIRTEGVTALSQAAVAEIVARHQEMGAIFNLRAVTGIRTDLETAYRDEGFFAQVDDIKFDDDSPQTLVISVIEARVASITLTGLNRTKLNTVKRVVKTREGDLYNEKSWIRDLQELQVTGWFDTFNPRRAIGDEPGEIDLAVEFVEAKTAILGGGVALDPQSRLVGTISYNDSNWRGAGQKVGVQLFQSPSGGGASGEVAYTDPFFDDKGTRLNAQIFSKVVYNFTGSGFGVIGGNDSEDSRFDERRTGLSLSLDRKLTDRHRFTYGLNAQAIRTVNLDTTGTGTGTGTQIDYIQQDGDLASLQFAYEYDTRPPSPTPYQGRVVRFQLEPGYSNITKIGGNVANLNNLLGSSTFVRSTVDYRQYWRLSPQPEDPLAAPRDVLAVRARYGRIEGTVPFFEQLFLGGSGSLRGFDNQQLWGSESMLATVEWRRAIQRNFQIIAFGDVGSAWGGYGSFNNLPQTGSFDLRTGFGVGLAFNAGIAPIRIDFAINDEGRSRTHFSFGTAF